MQSTSIWTTACFGPLVSTLEWICELHLRRLLIGCTIYDLGDSFNSDLSLTKLLSWQQETLIFVHCRVTVRYLHVLPTCLCPDHSSNPTNHSSCSHTFPTAVKRMPLDRSLAKKSRDFRSTILILVLVRRNKVQLYVRIGDYMLKIAKPLIFPRAFP